MHNFTTLAAPAEFSDRDNDDDVFIFSAPFKLKPQREKGERRGNNAKVICIAFFWRVVVRRGGEGSKRRRRVFLMLRDAAPFSFLSFSD